MACPGSWAAGSSLSLAPGSDVTFSCRPSLVARVLLHPCCALPHAGHHPLSQFGCWLWVPTDLSSGRPGRPGQLPGVQPVQAGPQGRWTGRAGASVDPGSRGTGERGRRSCGSRSPPSRSSPSPRLWGWAEPAGHGQHCRARAGCSLEAPWGLCVMLWVLAGRVGGGRVGWWSGPRGEPRRHSPGGRAGLLGARSGH